MEKPKRNHEQNSPLVFRLFGAIFRGLWYSLKGIASAFAWTFSNGAKAGWFMLQAIWRGSTWVLKLPYRLLRYLISGRIPQFENSRQEEIFWRIKRQYRRKRLFAFHSMAYFTGILLSLNFLLNEFFRFQAGYSYWEYFNQMLISVGFGLGIWTLLLVFHFVFNRMGNEEDKTLGEALEQEYARSDYQIERYDRLREPIIDEEDDYQSKPKRNGAKS